MIIEQISWSLYVLNIYDFLNFQSLLLWRIKPLALQHFVEHITNV